MTDLFSTDLFRKDQVTQVGRALNSYFNSGHKVKTSMLDIEHVIHKEIMPEYEENARYTLAYVVRSISGLPFHMRKRADKALVEAANGVRFSLEKDAAIKKKCREYEKVEGVAGLKLSAGNNELKEKAIEISTAQTKITKMTVEIMKDEGRVKENTIAFNMLGLYDELARFCLCNDITAPALKKKPTAKEIGTACRRMRCEGWLHRQIKKEQRRKLEAFSIRAEFVGKHLSNYVSPQTLSDWKERRARNRSILQDLEVYNHDLGILMPMLDEDSQGNEIGVFANNAANRRNEMMTRSRGLEEYLKDKGYTALFVTATAPTRFHRWQGIQKNPAYDNSTPRDSHAWLQTRWQRIRAEFGREGIDFAALRTAEPHKDGCAHWHMMIYVPSEQLAKIKVILHKYFILDDDFKSEKEKDHRIKNGLELKRINMSGDESATAYLAKYISKNIDGKASADGKEFTVEHEENVSRVLAWASVWGVRQFQFSNGGKVGIWREVRRLTNPKTLPEQVKQVFDAVNNADYGADDDASWGDYLKAMEGNPLSLSKEQDESETYGNPIERIKGLLFGGVELVTRVGEWVTYQKSAQWSKYSALKDGWSIRQKSAPWTCVNNCTANKFPISNGERIKLRVSYKKRCENRNERKKERLKNDKTEN